MEDEIFQSKPSRTRERSGNGIGMIIAGLLVVSILVGIVSIVTRKEPARQEAKNEAAEFFEALTGSMGSGKGPGIAVVKVYGPISMDEQRGFPGISDQFGSNAVVKRLKEIRKDDNIKGVLLHVNSPGGTVAASQEIANEVKALRQDKKPVFVSMGDLAASGGYYVSAPANKIFANAGTLTGSIGVYVGNLNFVGLKEKIGIDFTIIKGGKHKDILSSWRGMSDEERQLLQTTVNNIYDQFLTEVSSGRGIPMDELKTFADGRLFTGTEAKDRKLVDEVGSLQDAILALWKETGLTGEPKIVREKNDPFGSFMELLQTRAAGPTQQPTLQSFITGTSFHTSAPVTVMYPGLLN